MHSRLPFTFGIPLLPRLCARNWQRVEHLVELTITSVLAQTDQDFRVIVAGHDRPERLPADPRIEFLQARWAPEPIDVHNRDRGRKAEAVNARVLDDGGGLLMFLDADDWVEARLVQTARSAIRPHHVGGFVRAGFGVDFQTLRAAPLPHPDVFSREFHRVCGSSVIYQLKPGDRDALRRNPYPFLHEHHRIVEEAASRGAELADVAAPVAYVINTAENHSELDGPYTDWRRRFTDALNRVGDPVDDSFARRFGLVPDRLRAAASRHVPDQRAVGS